MDDSRGRQPDDTGQPSPVGWGLARYQADGSLDPTFGEGGKVTTRFEPGLNIARDVAIQPDGKILAVGYAAWEFGFWPNFTLVRYLDDGSLDPGFGGAGIVVTSLLDDEWDGATALAIQPDGRILLAGWAGTSDANPGDFALARYLAADEPTAVQLTPPAAGPGLTLNVFPNPSVDGLTIFFHADPRDPIAVVEIIDPAGRVVRRWDPQIDSSKGGTLRWDGRTADGRPAGSGLFLVRASNHRAAVATKAIFTR